MQQGTWGEIFRDVANDGIRRTNEVEWLARAERYRIEHQRRWTTDPTHFYLPALKTIVARDAVPPPYSVGETIVGDTRDFVVADDTANRFVERVALVPSASGGWEVWATGEPWEIPLSPNPFEPVSSLEGENMALRTSSILKQALSDELEWQPLLSGGRTTVWFDQDGSTERFQDWISLERWAEPHPQRGTTDIVYVDTADNALAIVHPVPGGGATMQIVQFTGRDKLADAVKTLVPKALSLDDLAGKRDVSLHDIIEASHAKKEPNPFAPKEKASDLER